MPDDDTLNTGWFVMLGDKREGPLDEEQVRSLIAAGRIDGQTLVRREGFSDWVPISTLPVFSKDVAPAPPAPLPRSQDAAEGAFILSALIWVIQLLLYLIWAIALPSVRDPNAVWGGTECQDYLYFLVVSGVFFVWYLKKDDTARVLAIIFSATHILMACAAFIEEHVGIGSAISLVIGILLNIAFILLAIRAKPVFHKKSRTA